MKRNITAVVFILAAITIALWGYFDMKNICEELIDALTQTVQLAENEKDTDDKEATINAAKKCAVLWEDKGERLEIYLNHDEIDAVQIDFKSIERYALGEQEIMLNEVCYECINNLEHIIESESLSLGTIL